MKEASKSVLSLGATAHTRSWGGTSQKLRASMSSAGVTDDASSSRRRRRASGDRGATVAARSRPRLKPRKRRTQAPTMRRTDGMTHSAYSTIECSIFEYGTIGTFGPMVTCRQVIWFAPRFRCARPRRPATEPGRTDPQYFVLRHSRIPASELYRIDTESLPRCTARMACTVTRVFYRLSMERHAHAA